MAYFIDETYALYEYDFNNRQAYYIADLRGQIEVHGEVSSIIKQKKRLLHRFQKQWSHCSKIYVLSKDEISDTENRNTFRYFLSDER